MVEQASPDGAGLPVPLGFLNQMFSVWIDGDPNGLGRSLQRPSDETTKKGREMAPGGVNADGKRAGRFWRPV